MSGAAQQLVFALPHRAAMAREDFLVTPSNQATVAWLDKWPQWPTHTLIIHGPAGSGKTHLVHVWQAQSHAKTLSPEQLMQTDIDGLPSHVAVDGADHAGHDTAYEEALLHLFNLLKEKGGTLLLTAKVPPKQWQIALPDLRSRLLASQTAALHAPDDQLVAGLFVKQFSDRQLLVGQDVLDYLVSRVERHPAVIAKIVVALDQAALAANRAVTVPLARKVLEEFPPSA